MYEPSSKAPGVMVKACFTCVVTGDLSEDIPPPKLFPKLLGTNPSTFPGGRTYVGDKKEAATCEVIKSTGFL